MTTTMMTITTMIITKIKIKAGTTTIKYQRMMHHIMIIVSVIAIRQITKKIIMIPQETGIMTPKMRNMKMVMFMNLKMMIMI